mgnify:CR=1 FL=1
MNNFATIKHINTFRKVSYYSLCLNGEKESMFEKFQHVWLKNEKHRKDLLQIVFWIKRMGERDGALERYFRHEGKAHALPPPASFIQGHAGHLRLYCMVVNPCLVFLFSGDVKTKKHPQDCPNVASHFRDAGRFSKKIEEAIISKEIKPSDLITDHHLIIDAGFEILY